jgi:hypothetical protein
MTPRGRRIQALPRFNLAENGHPNVAMSRDRFSFRLADAPRRSANPRRTRFLNLSLAGSLDLVISRTGSRARLTS